MRTKIAIHRPPHIERVNNNPAQAKVTDVTQSPVPPKNENHLPDSSLDKAKQIDPAVNAVHFKPPFDPYFSSPTLIPLEVDPQQLILPMVAMAEVIVSSAVFISVYLYCEMMQLFTASPVSSCTNTKQYDHSNIICCAGSDLPAPVLLELELDLFRNSTPDAICCVGTVLESSLSIE